ncbi:MULTISPECIES: asparagine synthase-related protein [unclassified Streptomyces]|uniref:asparagine synthase-related protein n=1 Tax=unclassified Streptomyces TaxID=2593676 RepID=UPI002E2D2DA2|nr:asparagine synthase-related protein [Streptomyces sp. NBC_00223]
MAGSCGADDDALTPATAAGSRWAGSHLTVVQNGRGLRVRGDLAGLWPVFYTCPGDGTLVWATAAAPLAALTGAEPDLVRVVAGIALSGVDAFGSHSYFPGVHRVPPGSELVVDVAGPRTVAYEDLRPPIDPEAREAVAAALTEAVDLRMAASRQPSADLSGGKDSSTLACLASQRTEITAFTYTDDRSVNADLDYARAVATAFPGMDHRIVTGDAGTTDYARLSDPAAVPVTDAPVLALGVLGLLRTMHAAVADCGSDMHLCGEGGDAVLTGDPALLADLLRQRRLRDAAVGGATWSRVGLRSVQQTWLRTAALARTSYPGALACLASRLRGPDPLAPSANPLTWCATRPATGWLTRPGRDALAALVSDSASWAPADLEPGLVHQWQGIWASGAQHGDLLRIAADDGVHALHLPYLDNAVIRACVASDPLERLPGHSYKPLLNGLAPTVPALLLERTSSGAFDGTGHAGVQRRHAWLREIIGTSRLAAAGLLDRTAARAGLDRAVVGAGPLSDLRLLICAETWLTTVLRDRATWWTTDPNPQEAACAGG